MPPRKTQLIVALALLPLARDGAAAVPPAAAGTYTMIRCIKTLPGKSDEYRQFMLETTRKTMQVRADEGDLEGWIFAKSIIPQGAESACDYLLFNVHRGFPPERVPIDPYFVKAKVKITREEWYAKLGSQSKLIRMELWRGLEQAGTVEKGNFLRFDFLEVPPAKLAEWTRREGGATGKAVQEGRIRRGDLHGWLTHELVLPAGSAHGYNAASIDVYRDWAAIGRAPQQRLSRGRELAKSELYEVIEVVRPSAAASRTPGP